MKVLFATTNGGKIRELRELSAGLAVEVEALPEGQPQVPEHGDSFAANALYKAEAHALRRGGWALADDSGLEVEALGGRPGIHSARWSGGGDQANNARLLRELEGVPPERRGARYVCALALSDGRESYLVEAECRGRIAVAPRGEGGFGYDPLFEADGLSGRTFGEATAEEKAHLSHRAKAFAKLRPILGPLAKDH